MLPGRVADALLLVFLTLLVAGTVVQVRHNAGTGPRGPAAPHANPVATRVAHVR